MSKKDFMTYHNENPQVWHYFKRFAFEAIEKNRKKIGAKLIFERIRWYTQIKTSGDFKVNNNYTADYARHFERQFPEHRGLFEKRQRKTFH